MDGVREGEGETDEEEGVWHWIGDEMESGGMGAGVEAGVDRLKGFREMWMGMGGDTCKMERKNKDKSGRQSGRQSIRKQAARMKTSWSRGKREGEMGELRK